MARKTSRRRQPTRRRTTSQPAPHQSTSGGAAPAPSAPGSATARVEMALGARPQGGSRQRKAARQILVEDSDPGIPLNQVPFFTKDLTRLGITVAGMVVLMLVGAQVLLHFWG